MKITIELTSEEIKGVRRKIRECKSNQTPEFACKVAILDWVGDYIYYPKKRKQIKEEQDKRIWKQIAEDRWYGPWI